VSQKSDTRFLFCDNFHKCTPILTIFHLSLLSITITFVVADAP